MKSEPWYSFAYIHLSCTLLAAVISRGFPESPLAPLPLQLERSQRTLPPSWAPLRITPTTNSRDQSVSISFNYILVIASTVEIQWIWHEMTKQSCLSLYKPWRAKWFWHSGSRVITNGAFGLQQSQGCCSVVAAIHPLLALCLPAHSKALPAVHFSAVRGFQLSLPCVPP